MEGRGIAHPACHLRGEPAHGNLIGEVVEASDEEDRGRVARADVGGRGRDPDRHGQAGHRHAGPLLEPAGLGRGHERDGVGLAGHLDLSAGHGSRFDPQEPRGDPAGRLGDEGGQLLRVVAEDGRVVPALAREPFVALGEQVVEVHDHRETGGACKRDRADHVGHHELAAGRLGDRANPLGSARGVEERLVEAQPAACEADEVASYLERPGERDPVHLDAALARQPLWLPARHHGHLERIAERLERPDDRGDHRLSASARPPGVAAGDDQDARLRV